MRKEDYIPRGEAEKVLMQKAVADSDRNGRTWAKAICAIKDIPAADVEPVRHGRWIRVQWVEDEDYQEGGYWILRCSECTMPYHVATPFCPHCGAKMDKEPTDA